jgi:hypothetical protein
MNNPVMAKDPSGLKLKVIVGENKENVTENENTALNTAREQIKDDISRLFLMDGRPYTVASELQKLSETYYIAIKKDGPTVYSHEQQTIFINYHDIERVSKNKQEGGPSIILTIHELGHMYRDIIEKTYIKDPDRQNKYNVPIEEIENIITNENKLRELMKSELEKAGYSTERTTYSGSPITTDKNEGN